MKRPVRLLSMIAAALLAAPALAGEIVKCVDSGGHVTLTDQPCESGSASVPLARDTGGPVRERHVLPAAELPRVAWKKPSLAAPVKLARDVATLKEARRMLMLQDARPRLAGLN
ncbi:DUF4124 domain-containing protein [Massilia sp. TW-1]|uniref:DUF4124 domain-containing protein n=1 Tax=Telluria antibiotica TaxID=2717319 RepID=A0ABX0PB53_9BURK|nr:DUF4124 domain-containing protein [Telluria antibiotica]NIA54047.1 DUF4124 domain-containing protein [Telluria antibiotica]